MNVVWKFPLDRPGMSGVVDVSVPLGTRFISVAVEPDDTIVAYGVVNPDMTTRERTLIVVNTGDPVSVLCPFLGTVKTSTGIVWHVFEAQR